MHSLPQRDNLFTISAHIDTAGSGYSERLARAEKRGLPAQVASDFLTYEAMQQERDRLVALLGVTGDYVIATGAVGRAAVLETCLRDKRPCPAWATEEERAKFKGA